MCKRIAPLVLSVLVAVTLVGAGTGTASSTPAPGPAERGTSAAAGKTSSELINDALRSRRISSEQALLYKVFVQYRDSRLPAQFRGDDSTVRESTVMMEVAEAYATLSSKARQTLEPFFIPPTLPGSWLQLPTVRGGAAPGDRVEVGRINTPHALVWFVKDEEDGEASARMIANAFQRVIWPKLTGLMGRQPRSDAREDRTWVNDDGRLDIFVTRMVTSSATNPYEPFTSENYCRRPMNIDLQIMSNPKEMLATTAHEFMHVLEGAFDVVEPCKDTKWWRESSATWTEDFVYPIFDTEQYSAEFHMRALAKPLDYGKDANESLTLWYGRYVWPFYLARKSSPKLVARIWQASERMSILKATDQSIPGRFKKRWPEFSRYNWNRPPVDKYDTWDGLKDVPRPHGAFVVKLAGAAQREFPLAVDVPYLSAYHYRFTFTDPNVRSVAFFNPLGFEPRPEINETATVEALVKIEGEAWKVEDWSKRLSRTFCRDVKKERIEELVVIISNSEFENKKHKLLPGLETKLTATNIGCWRWQGTVTATHHQDGAPTVDERQRTTMTFERTKDPAVPDFTDFTEFHPVSGDIAWEHDGTFGLCFGGDTGTLAFGEDDYLRVGNFEPDGTIVPFRKFISDGNAGARYTVDYACPDGSSIPVPGPFVEWFTTKGEHESVSADGAHIDGTLTITHPFASASTTWEWHFTALRE